MFRRLLRFFSVVGLVVIVGLAVVGQFRHVYFTPSLKHSVEVSFSGIDLTVLKKGFQFFNPPIGFQHIDRANWTLKNIFRFPNLHFRSAKAAGAFYIFLPWWLILLAYGPFAAFVWHLTRRRKIGQGFPIEPTVASN
jgi:hypothetical protein